MSWIAEYDTQGREFPTCVHVTKTTDTMTHGATYVPIEDGKSVRAENAKLQETLRTRCQQVEAGVEALIKAQAENKKLQKVCKEMHDHIKDSCDVCDEYYCSSWDEDNECCVFDSYMRELGVEVGK